MPGQISEIYVNEGDLVLKGDRLVVLESMKMEHAISANMSGKIESILVSKGQKVDNRELILRIYLKSDSRKRAEQCEAVPVSCLLVFKKNWEQKI